MKLTSEVQCALLEGLLAGLNILNLHKSNKGMKRIMQFALDVL